MASKYIRSPYFRLVERERRLVITRVEWSYTCSTSANMREVSRCSYGGRRSLLLSSSLDTVVCFATHLFCFVSMPSEYDNGRLLRLLLKLGTLNERPDRSGGEWAETGERYILKLFRDYCFHQVGQSVRR